MHYRERLSVPVAWWVLSALFALSLLLAFGFYLGPVWGAGAGLASLLVTTAMFVTAAVEIRVTDTALLVGRANIELSYLGKVSALEPVDARRRRGPDADARAFLVLRPYLSGAVEIEISDADDPAPYWLVATRRPQAFAAALVGMCVRSAGRA